MTQDPISAPGAPSTLPRAPDSMSAPEGSSALPMAQDYMPAPWGHQSLSHWHCNRDGLQLPTVLPWAPLSQAHPWAHGPAWPWPVTVPREMPDVWGCLCAPPAALFLVGVDGMSCQALPCDALTRSSKLLLITETVTEQIYTFIWFFFGELTLEMV